MLLLEGMADPGPIAAFLAGLISFLSPCVLPLVPGYVSYMGGLSAGDVELSPRRRTLDATRAMAGFVGGFTVVFVALGATATILGRFLSDYEDIFLKVSGVLIILLGLVFLGVVKIPFLYREARFHPSAKAGFWGSATLGAAFAFGWSPCIGATLGPILAMAAGRGDGSAAQGAGLLAVYSLGLGVPFILAGLGVTRLTGAVKWLRTHTRTITWVGGVFLIGMGILFLTDRVFEISIWMQRLFNAVGLEELSQI
jgi:cytochrome c-type biogenesis protein